ncbi:DUF4179 domain-containing protein [Metabacillus fastidiosus]|uniref:DUF4179 domain-containing protein n=1 Tax=Metabacillus fastidiosus TaxID=1458 RepID=UPI003D282797
MTKSYKDWLDLDIENIESMDLSDKRKKDIKNHVLTNSPKKKQILLLRYLVAAAIIIISSITTVSMTFPAGASQIPFVKNVISYFVSDIEFDKYATRIDEVQTDNGISIMIDSAVYDGTFITVSYAVKSEIDLGESPFLANNFDISGSKGWTSAGRPFEKINKNMYVGLEKIKPEFIKDKPNKVIVSWKPDSFINTEKNVEVKGDWQFKFELSKLKSKLQFVNKSTKQDGVTILIKSIETTDMSTVIKYEEFIDENLLKKLSSVTAQFSTVEDDLGNRYKVEEAESSSTDNGLSYKSSSEIKSIDVNAKSIKLFPKIFFSLGSGKGVEIKEIEPITIDLR